MCCARKYPYPSHGGFFGLSSSSPPTPNFSRSYHFGSYFALKILAFNPPPFPLRISKNPLGGYDDFWNNAIYFKICFCEKKLITRNNLSPLKSVFSIPPTEKQKRREKQRLICFQLKKYKTEKLLDGINVK